MTIYEKEHKLKKQCCKCGKIICDRNISGFCSVCRLIYNNPASNDSVRKKISKSMKLAHKEGRAYSIGIRDRRVNKFSRPEKWCNDVLKK